MTTKHIFYFYTLFTQPYQHLAPYLTRTAYWEALHCPTVSLFLLCLVMFFPVLLCSAMVLEEHCFVSQCTVPWLYMVEMTKNATWLDLINSKGISLLLNVSYYIMAYSCFFPLVFTCHVKIYQQIICSQNLIVSLYPGDCQSVVCGRRMHHVWFLALKSGWTAFWWMRCWSPWSVPKGQRKSLIDRKRLSTHFLESNGEDGSGITCSATLAS